MSESQKDKYINDQKYYERIGQGLGKEYEDRKKAEKKAEIEKRIIEKQGGIEFVTAKKKHLVHTRKKQIKKWKEDERPEIIRSLTTRKKGKVGTSKVGNVIHSFLYPVKKRKKARW
jgi:hypothetical protein